MPKLKCYMKPYIQPFERKLAYKELAVLAGAEPMPLAPDTENGYWVVDSKLPPYKLAERLAYWECVIGRERNFTTQVLREATVNIVRNGIQVEDIASLVPFDENVPLPNKRCLRYGPHGLHEYRGKFFPQLVKALINLTDLKYKGVIADPMCGSGTTAVEAVLSGNITFGMDFNSLSVLIARTKCAVLSITPEDLITTYTSVRHKLLSKSMRVRRRDLTYFYSLPEIDQSYLRKWFAEQVLLDLDEIVQILNSLAASPMRDLMRLSLSNILRAVSWQKEDDLRVRRDIRLDADIDPLKDFLEELGRSVRTLLSFLYQNQKYLGTFNIQEGDARFIDKVWKKKSVDIVITSPPYATALPYLDTDRLSLIYLKLSSRSQHRQKEFGMIGNREITKKWRRTYWARFQAEKNIFPKNVTNIIKKIDRLNSGSDAGFRRLNLPSLLAKYFFDMRSVLKGISRILKSGAMAYIVVGNNHTIAGGEKVEIRTAEILGEIAESVGLKPIEYIPMEMLLSRDIFKKNAIPSETILAFRQLD